MCASCACEAIGGASVICGSRERYDTFAKVSGHYSAVYATRTIRVACPVERIRNKWVYPNVSHVGKRNIYILYGKSATGTYV